MAGLNTTLNTSVGGGFGLTSLMKTGFAPGFGARARLRTLLSITNKG